MAFRGRFSFGVYAGLSVEIFLERWVFEAYVMAFMPFHNEVISEFSQVPKFQVVSSEVSVRKLSLL